MHCHEACHLLNLGVLSGVAGPVQTQLGVHLSSCANCRGYRAHLHDQRTLQALLEQAPPLRTSAPTRTPVSSRTISRLRTMSTSVALCSALTLSILNGGLAAGVANAHPAFSAAQGSQRAANVSHIARLDGDTAVLGSRVPANWSRLGRRAGDSALLATLLNTAIPNQAAGAALATDTGDNALLTSLLSTDIQRQGADLSLNTPSEDITQDTGLKVGMELMIPMLPQSLEDVAAAPAGQVAPLALYVVQAGDTLSAIAQRFYNDASLWNAIYMANQGVIGGDPRVIVAGQTLTIPAKPQTNTQNPGTRVYTVQPGDTLSAIALWAYGDANQWRTIYDANLNLIGGNYNLIFPGQQLTIPAAPVAYPSSKSIATANTSGSSGGYTVVSGDTLSGIAQRYYGDGNLWKYIYQQNAGVIGGNPNLIFPGQQLVLPASF